MLGHTTHKLNLSFKYLKTGDLCGVCVPRFARTFLFLTTPTVLLLIKFVLHSLAYSGLCVAVTIWRFLQASVALRDFPQIYMQIPGTYPKTDQVTFLRLSLTLRRLMSYIYGAPILDVSRSHTTTQHSR